MNKKLKAKDILNLRIGDYIRTNYGFIGKLLDIDEHDDEIIWHFDNIIDIYGEEGTNEVTYYNKYPEEYTFSTDVKKMC